MAARSSLRERLRVATISAGYADGYPRTISNRDAAVLIGGRRCPVLGRVTMDLTMVDVSDVPEVRAGRRSGVDREAGRRRNSRGGSGGARRHDRVGDLHRNWQSGAAGVFVGGES